MSRRQQQQTTAKLLIQTDKSNDNTKQIDNSINKKYIR